MRKKTTEQTPKLDTKTFNKLMQKREEIVKVIARNERKLDKVDAQLGQFADWLKSLTQKQ